MGTHLGPSLSFRPRSLLSGCFRGRWRLRVRRRGVSWSSRAVTWRSCRYLGYAVSEQEGWRRRGTYLGSP